MTDPQPDTRDVVVVGGGPSGLSAAMVLGRCRRSVLVIDDGEPRNAVARQVGGYLGRDRCPPLELLALGRREVERYDVEVRRGRVVSATTREQGGFRVTVEDGTVFQGRKLLLCTGIADRLPDVDGLRRYYGRGVHHCPYCDAWDHRDGVLAAYGDPEHVLPLALSLRTWSDRVLALTDGRVVPADERESAERHGVRLVEDRVRRLEGGEEEAGVLERVVLDGGETLAVDGLFFHTERTQHSELPRQLGCTMDARGEVQTDARQGTGVPGLYLAGDACGDVQFVVVAAAEGAKAAVHINIELQKEDLGDEGRRTSRAAVEGEA